MSNVTKRLIIIETEGTYPQLNQYARWFGYEQGRDNMQVAEDLRFFIENKIKAQPNS